MNDFSPTLILQQLAESSFLHFKTLATSIPGFFWSASFVAFLTVMARILAAIWWKYSRRQTRLLASEDWFAPDEPTGSLMDGTCEVAGDFNWEALKLACLKEMNWAKSYRSRTLIQEFTIKGLAKQNYILSQWRAQFVRPNRWAVMRQGMINNKPCWDEWITIGDQDFQNVGIWFRLNAHSHKKENQFLSGDRYLEMLRRRSPISVKLTRKSGARNIVAEFEPEDSFELISGTGPHGNTNLRSVVRIWIEEGTARLVRGEHRILDGDRVIGKLSQVFTDFGEPIVIGEPVCISDIEISSENMTNSGSKKASSA